MVTDKSNALDAINLQQISWEIPQESPRESPRELTGEGLRRALVFAALQGGAMLLGGLLAQMRFAGHAFFGTAPFAIALAAAGSIRYLGMSVLGAAIGSFAFLPYPANISVMAAAGAAGLFNLAVRKLGLARKGFVPVCAFACSLASGVICLLSPQSAFYLAPGATKWVFALCGAVLCGCSSYFIILAQAGLSGGQTDRAGRRRYHINRRERAALLLCCSMLLASCGGAAMGWFRPAHIAAVLFVLAAAHCWREAGGAIAGCCAGAALVLAADEPAFTAVFALGGLLAGVFSTLHGNTEPNTKSIWKGSAFHFIKNISTEHEFAVPTAFLTVPVAGGFALVCVFFVALRANDADPAPAVVFAIESLLAILIFLLIPARLWNALRLRFAAPEEAALTPPEAEAVLQLSQTAGALRKVSEYVEEVAQGLEQLQLPPEQSVYASAAQEVCRTCPDHDVCHKEHGNSAAKLSAQYLKRMRRYGSISVDDLEIARQNCGIEQPCRRGEAMCRALMQAYEIHCAKKAGNQAQTQLRRAAAEQFDSLSLLLDEVGARLARQKEFDSGIAESAACVLEDHGYHTSSVFCAHGEEQAAQLQARVIPESDRSSREELTAAIGRATGIAFDLPARAPVSGEAEVLLTFHQRPRYALETGAVQMSSAHSDYCGDFFDCFDDGSGREVLIISDGMGTGGRAAVDSALATEIFSALVRTGLSFEGSVRIANQALLLKSNEESLATIDAAGVNLYTGEVEFCKAGGAASFLRRRGKVSKIELSALPAGILRSIRPAQFRAMLEPGDLLVMVSDGMLGTEEPDWICAALEDFDGSDMQELAELLTGLAVRQRQQAAGQVNAREDDLTVICGRLSVK